MDEFDFERLEETDLVNIPDEKLPFQHWLRKQMALFQIKQLSKGKTAREADFARWLGITTYNLSQYKNGNRRPSARIAKEIAKRLGPATFDKLDLPRSVPNDRALLYIVDNWHILDDREQKELLETARNLTDEARTREQRRLPNTKNAT